MLLAIAAITLSALAAEAADSPPSQPGVATEASAANAAPAAASEAPSPPASPTPAVAAPGPTATAAAAAPAPAASGGQASEPIVLSLSAVPPPADFKPPAGYKAVKRGLDTVYCTSVTPVGSRMPEKVCMSREQLEAAERQAEINRRKIREQTHTGGTSGG
jgi:hypothetical protein